MEIKFKEPIDLVYLWVDDKDPVWQEKRKSYLDNTEELRSEATSDCRIKDNDELKLSLRSVEKHLPWINRIFIVTDNQIPSWLDTTHPKIRVIFHEDFIPREVLPTFNSNVIESYLHKIPDLSEHFLYANDDMFVNQNLTPDFFFTNDGKPIARLHKIKRENVTPSTFYFYLLKQTQKLIKNKFDKTYNLEPHHCIDAYTKTLLSECTKEFNSAYSECRKNRFRKENDVQRLIILLFGLATKQAVLKTIPTCRFYLPIGSKLFNKITGKYNLDSQFLGLHRKKLAKRFEWINPKLFCLNDNINVTEQNRMDANLFLHKLFPEKSSFEKINKNGIAISIIVPIYNTAKYLNKCLDSLINQTMNNIEIICVNDGSTDNSLEILREYEQKDQRIKVINQQNQGVSVARNNAIKIANGDYITFVDSDDWLELNTCEEVYNRITDDCSDALIYSYNSVSEKHQKKTKNFSEVCSKSLIFNSTIDKYLNELIYLPVIACGKVYRREFLLDNNLLFPVGIHQSEDHLFWYNVISAKPKFSIFDKPFYNYLNVRDGNSFENLEKSYERFKTFDELMHKTDLYINASPYYKMILDDRNLNFYCWMWFKHRNQRDILVPWIENAINDFNSKYRKFNKRKLFKYNSLMKKLIKYKLKEKLGLLEK